MTIPRKFRKTGEKAIATFDAYDLDEGTGITKFTGFKSFEDAVESGELSSQDTVYSSDIETTTSTVALTTSWVAYIDEDFDIAPFNVPKIVKGVAYVNFTGSARAVSNSSNMWEYYKATRVIGR